LPLADGRPGAPDIVVFDVYGLTIAVSGDWPEVVRDLRGDFLWFVARRPEAADLVVTIERRAPDFGAAGDLVASFVTPRNVVYHQPGRTVIDYFGQALSLYDRALGQLTVQGTDHDLVHEAAYHFILSRVGAHLEAIGRPRLHGLGLAGRGGAVAVLLPPGGGKSTLAVSALRAGTVKLLSEDSPLIDRRGMMHPFPLRLGVNPSDAHRLPAGRVRTLARMESTPKTVLELDGLADRIESDAQPLRHLVIGRRTLGTGAALEPIGRRRLVAPLLRECVVGVGLYQGLEFILQHGLRDLAGTAGSARVRAQCSAVALAKAQTWELRLGRDHDANWAALGPLVQ